MSNFFLIYKRFFMKAFWFFSYFICSNFPDWFLPPFECIVFFPSPAVVINFGGAENNPSRRVPWHLCRNFSCLFKARQRKKLK